MRKLPLILLAPLFLVFACQARSPRIFETGTGLLLLWDSRQDESPSPVTGNLDRDDDYPARDQFIHPDGVRVNDYHAFGFHRGHGQDRVYHRRKQRQYDGEEAHSRWYSPDLHRQRYDAGDPSVDQR